MPTESMKPGTYPPSCQRHWRWHVSVSPTRLRRYASRQARRKES